MFLGMFQSFQLVEKKFCLRKIDFLTVFYIKINFSRFYIDNRAKFCAESCFSPMKTPRGRFLAHSDTKKKIRFLARNIRGDQAKKIGNFSKCRNEPKNIPQGFSWAKNTIPSKILPCFHLKIKKNVIFWIFTILTTQDRVLAITFVLISHFCQFWCHCIAQSMIYTPISKIVEKAHLEKKLCSKW